VLSLPATLTHDQALETAHGLRTQLAAQPEGVVIDASALTQFDSSALAVMLACRREAMAAGKTFAVRGLPARLAQLAGLYGVAELIPSAA
jgi:phospholipid transport system transporter-binding protein